jgi:hypothetical protein
VTENILTQHYNKKNFKLLLRIILYSGKYGSYLPMLTGVELLELPSGLGGEVPGLLP